MQSLIVPEPVDTAGAAGAASPVVDVVIPVHDEESVLARSVGLVHAYLSDGFPFSWRITIADNASTDRTWAVARELADHLDGVMALRLDRKGRGLALRTAWARSDAAVVAYMDVDLSTGLDAFLPLVAPLVSGHSDLAIGSRLAASAHVARGPRRELISRSYNRILRTVFASKVRDAQCGFKAVRADIARQLLPEVQDDGWFFDTELLLLADHNGLRIHELPVDWIDDPDSSVDVVGTAAGDLAGTARIGMAVPDRSGPCGPGRVRTAGTTRRSRPPAGHVRGDRCGQHDGLARPVPAAASCNRPLGGQRRRAGSDLRGQRLGQRPLHGAAPTGPLAPGGGDVPGVGGPVHGRALMVRALGAGPAVEVVVLLASWLAASMARLALVDGWTGRDGRP